MKFISNFRIGTRMLWLSIVIAIAFVACNSLAVWSVTSINQHLDALMLEAQKMLTIRAAESAMDGVNRHVVGMILAPDAAAVKIDQDEITKARAEYMSQMTWLKANITSPEGVALLANMDASVSTLRDSNNKIIEMVGAGKKAEATQIYLAEHISKRIALEGTTDVLLAWQQKRLDAIDAEALSLTSQSTIIQIVIGVVMLVFGLIFTSLIARSLTAPIRQCLVYLEKMAHGDFRVVVADDVAGLKDEMGDVARAIAAMLGNLKPLLADVHGSAGSIASTSSQLTDIAMMVSSNVTDTSAKINMVAAAAEEMSANTMSVAGGIEQASANLHSVGIATEEMTATIGEIAGNSEKARRITDLAVTQTARISTVVRELGRAAQEIGKVTETITSISNQTHLLALNATIEAARAGAAGKGFAVVATEIKELAQQTAAATEDIKAKVSGVQSSTVGAVSDIEKISQVIQDVSEIVTTIATAIEEQSVVTRDIAGNISQATNGVHESSERVAQISSVTQSVASDIAIVSMSEADLIKGGQQVQTSAVELSALAQDLNDKLARFQL
jgi:methyl-accepting chemotaxis protein